MGRKLDETLLSVIMTRMKEEGPSFVRSTMAKELNINSRSKIVRYCDRAEERLREEKASAAKKARMVHLEVDEHTLDRLKRQSGDRNKNQQFLGLTVHLSPEQAQKTTKGMRHKPRVIKEMGQTDTGTIPGHTGTNCPPPIHVTTEGSNMTAVAVPVTVPEEVNTDNKKNNNEYIYRETQIPLITGRQTGLFRGVPVEKPIRKKSTALVHRLMAEFQKRFQKLYGIRYKPTGKCWRLLKSMEVDFDTGCAMLDIFFRWNKMVPGLPQRWAHDVFWLYNLRSKLAAKVAKSGLDKPSRSSNADVRRSPPPGWVPETIESTPNEYRMGQEASPVQGVGVPKSSGSRETAAKDRSPGLPVGQSSSLDRSRGKPGDRRSSGVREDIRIDPPGQHRNDDPEPDRSISRRAARECVEDRQPEGIVPDRDQVTGQSGNMVEQSGWRPKDAEGQTGRRFTVELPCSG